MIFKELFSQRNGFKEKRKIQSNSLDKYSINHLWDYIDDKVNTRGDMYRTLQQDFINVMYSEIFERPIDEAYMSSTAYSRIRKYWFTELAFYERMDVLEILIRVCSDGLTIIELNLILTNLLIPYRVLNEQIVPVDNEEEYKEIDQAIKEIPHIEKAAKLLYDRENPDYKNSVKESILALEKKCKSISNENKLDKSWANIKELYDIPQVHFGYFKKLQGYYSNEDGVRHATDKISKIDFKEAKYVLVMCSAIINFLKECESEKR